MKVGTEHGLRAGFQEQQDADGGNHVVQLGSIAQGMEHQAIGQHGNHRDRCCGTQHGQPVVQAQRRHQVVADEGACHIESAVGEIRHVQDAVDQGQAQRHKAVHATDREAIQKLLEKQFHFNPCNAPRAP